MAALAASAASLAAQAFLALADRAFGLLPQPGQPQMRRHAGKQFAGAERFDQVIVGPGLQSFHARLLSCAGPTARERGWSGCRNRPAQPSQQFKAVHAGHHDIGDYHVRPAVLDSLQRRRDRSPPLLPGNARSAIAARNPACQRCRQRQGFGRRRLDEQRPRTISAGTASAASLPAAEASGSHRRASSTKKPAPSLVETSDRPAPMRSAGRMGLAQRD